MWWGREFGAGEEIALRLEELLFLAIMGVEVLSVDVNIAIVRVDAQCTADGAAYPGCGCGRPRWPAACAGTATTSLSSWGGDWVATMSSAQRRLGDAAVELEPMHS